MTVVRLLIPLLGSFFPLLLVEVLLVLQIAEEDQQP